MGNSPCSTESTAISVHSHHMPKPTSSTAKCCTRNQQQNIKPFREYLFHMHSLNRLIWRRGQVAATCLQPLLQVEQSAPYRDLSAGPQHCPWQLSQRAGTSRVADGSMLAILLSHPARPTPACKPQGQGRPMLPFHTKCKAIHEKSPHTLTVSMHHNRLRPVIHDKSWTSASPLAIESTCNAGILTAWLQAKHHG